ncbi:MAG: hypothetical protein G01um10145_593 [Microgenomates group bacterium Gr01-1014_5]|nr:MAG: hypothetical protein G01um10145_593 [Microgenomates group bacterium Gr01-1014_5]
MRDLVQLPRLQVSVNISIATDFAADHSLTTLPAPAEETVAGAAVLAGQQLLPHPLLQYAQVVTLILLIAEVVPQDSGMRTVDIMGHLLLRETPGALATPNATAGQPQLNVFLVVAPLLLPARLQVVEVLAPLFPLKATAASMSALSPAVPVSFTATVRAIIATRLAMLRELRLGAGVLL